MGWFGGWGLLLREGFGRGLGVKANEIVCSARPRRQPQSTDRHQPTDLGGQLPVQQQVGRVGEIWCWCWQAGGGCGWGGVSAPPEQSAALEPTRVPIQNDPLAIQRSTAHSTAPHIAQCSTPHSAERTAHSPPTQPAQDAPPLSASCSMGTPL